MERLLRLPLQWFAEGGEEPPAPEEGEQALGEAVWEAAEDGGAPAEEAPGEGEKDERIVRLTHLGQAREVPLSEAVSLAQKGLDYDHIRQERDELRRDPAWEVLDAFAARSGLSRGEYVRALKEQMAGAAPSPEEGRRAEYRRFFEAYPEVGVADIPDEVWRRAAAGEPLVEAYRRHENAQLKAKLAALEQNERNRQAAVGSLAGEAGQDEADPFLQGFFE